MTVYLSVGKLNIPTIIFRLLNIISYERQSLFLWTHFNIIHQIQKNDYKCMTQMERNAIYPFSIPPYLLSFALFLSLSLYFYLQFSVNVFNLPAKETKQKNKKSNISKSFIKTNSISGWHFGIKFAFVFIPNTNIEFISNMQIDILHVKRLTCVPIDL